MWDIDKSWTLFLDRDGTINHRIPNHYINSWTEFKFLPGVLESIPIFNKLFNRTIVVTNQQGIGKELMTEDEIRGLHDQMLDRINIEGGIIDEIYFCPDLAIYDPLCRKPNPGMALTAKKHFPDINFKKSIMVGDSISDMEFGKRLGMKTVFVGKRSQHPLLKNPLIDINFGGLMELAKNLLPLYTL